MILCVIATDFPQTNFQEGNFNCWHDQNFCHQYTYIYIYVTRPQWVDNKKAKIKVWRLVSHYLNQWWPSSLTHTCVNNDPVYWVIIFARADSSLALSQWETSLQCNAVSHWLGANLESALYATPSLNWSNPGDVALTICNKIRPASERRRYKVTPSLIGWAQT